MQRLSAIVMAMAVCVALAACGGGTASGTYLHTLIAELDKSKPPTLFVIGGPADVREWGEYAMDLTGRPLPTS